MQETERDNLVACCGSPLGNGRQCVSTTTIRVRGRQLIVPSITVDGRTVVRTGSWLKIGRIKDEDLIDGETTRDPEKLIAEVRKSNLNVDLLTFSQRVPDTEKRYNYWTEYDNAAALSISTYDAWIKNTEYSIRKGVRKAEKSGVVVREVEFSPELVAGISSVYDAAEVRQGRKFWHYGKSHSQVAIELGDYLERSVFMGAYWQETLIGFVKATIVNNTLTLTQILSDPSHFDKRPNNALLAHCVRLCEKHKWTHVIYGSLVYNDPDSSLTEFKRRIGFEGINLPRYFVPVTLKGRLALRWGLHRGILAKTPSSVIHALRDLRKRWYCLRRWPSEGAKQSSASGLSQTDH